MNSKSVLAYVIANWSLVSGGALAGLSSFMSTGSLKTALVAVGSYLLGHASVKSPQVNAIKAHFSRKSS
jgi:hypothetical protein